MTVPNAHFLFAVCRADARIHIKHDASWRTASMNAVDPLVGQIGKSPKILFSRKPSRLETPHLARRGCTTMSRLPADDPSHRGIMASRSASLTSSYPASRPNTACRNIPTRACPPFLSRASASLSPAVSERPSASSSSGTQANRCPRSPHATRSMGSPASSIDATRFLSVRAASGSSFAVIMRKISPATLSAAATSTLSR